MWILNLINLFLRKVFIIFYNLGESLSSNQKRKSILKKEILEVEKLNATLIAHIIYIQKIWRGYRVRKDKNNPKFRFIQDMLKKYMFRRSDTGTAEKNKRSSRVFKGRASEISPVSAFRKHSLFGELARKEVLKTKKIFKIQMPALILKRHISYRSNVLIQSKMKIVRNLREYINKKNSKGNDAFKKKGGRVNIVKSKFKNFIIEIDVNSEKMKTEEESLIPEVNEILNQENEIHQEELKKINNQGRRAKFNEVLKLIYDRMKMIRN